MAAEIPVSYISETPPRSGEAAPLTTFEKVPRRMAELIVIQFLTGAVPAFEVPTICHSGRPEPNRCHAVSHSPGREGWVLVHTPQQERRRTGWWCPDCARQLREEMAKLGYRVSSRDVPIGGAGQA